MIKVTILSEHILGCPFSKCFQILYIFGEIFKYFAVLPFFWKVAQMPLLSRIGPDYNEREFYWLKPSQTVIFYDNETLGNLYLKS